MFNANGLQRPFVWHEWTLRGVYVAYQSLDTSFVTGQPLVLGPVASSSKRTTEQRKQQQQLRF